MRKASQGVKSWRKKAKEIILTCMGGKCQICGYHKCPAALELHHVEPSEKEVSLSTIMTQCKSWDFIYTEITKCILLCSNCHREVHYDGLELPNEYVKFDPELADSLRSNQSKRVQRSVAEPKRKLKSQQREDRILHKEESIESRKERILNSGIDLTKHGRNAKIGKLIGISGQKAGKWIAKYMPELN